MTGARIALPLGLAVALAIAALAIVPRGLERGSLLPTQDDPVALADRARRALVRCRGRRARDRGRARRQ